uniref:TIR domain-containing protein n=1 Tax=Thermosporothrix sp. COM3 TaxID=2490863 RepID=A0A455SD89_9CHLR|nr:hypothetical protein KTC_11640 [Thermosporothrix sp. COM3]
MANPDHLAMLEQGVKRWNQWRTEHPEIVPDLEGADLSGRHFFQANFTGARMRKVNLRDTELYMTDFTDADLESANLVGAEISRTCFRRCHLEFASLVEVTSDVGTIFEEAMLRYTNWTQAFFCHGTFSRANLRHACMDEMIVRQVCFDGADLEGAKFWLTRFERSSLREANCSWTYLRGTVLHETDLTGTSFEKAVFWETGILNCPLHRARGLDQAYHVGRSFPDLQTIARAEGSLPPRFLRGCGLPETLSTNETLSLEEWKQRPSCFLVYAPAEYAFASRLWQDLSRNGVCCWLYPACEQFELWFGYREPPEEWSMQPQDARLLVVSRASFRVFGGIGSAAIQAFLQRKEAQSKEPLIVTVSLDQSRLRDAPDWTLLFKRTGLEMHVLDETEVLDCSGYQDEAVYQTILQDLLLLLNGNRQEERKEHLPGK